MDFITLLDLPEELMLMIMRNLETKEWGRTLQTCKTLHRICLEFYNSHRNFYIDKSLTLHPAIKYAYKHEKEFKEFCELGLEEIDELFHNNIVDIEITDDNKRKRRRKPQCSEISELGELEYALLFLFSNHVSFEEYVLLVNFDIFTYKDLVNLLSYKIREKVSYLRRNILPIPESLTEFIPDLSYFKSTGNKEDRYNYLSSLFPDRESVVSKLIYFLEKDVFRDLVSYKNYHLKYDVEFLFAGILTSSMVYLLEEETIKRCLKWYGFETKKKLVLTNQLRIHQNKLINNIDRFITSRYSRNEHNAFKITRMKKDR
jgi:F-box domain.